MKLYNLTDIDGFLKSVEEYTGRVELATSEDDRLNLKSKLCQYVAFTKLLNCKEIPELEVVAYNPEDVSRLIHFIIYK